MAEEIQEAVQIIRVMYDGIEIAMKVGSGGLHLLKKIVELLKNMMDYEKSLGKTGIRDLLKRGGDLQVFQFRQKDLKKVKKLAKKYGILYTVLPKINADKGLAEIIFHTEAVPRVNMMVQKLKDSRVSSFEDYLKEGNGEQMEKLSKFFNDEKQKGNHRVHTEDDRKTEQAMEDLLEKVGSYAMQKEVVSVDEIKEDFSVSREQAENVLGRLETIGVLSAGDPEGNHKVLMGEEAFLKRIQSYKNLAQRILAVSKSKNPNLLEIRIDKAWIAEESESSFKTKVPGTEGKDTRYLWLGKDSGIDIREGKSVLTFLEAEKEYKLYDEEGHAAETKTGRELCESHYNQLELAVKQKYEKLKKEREEQERKELENQKREADESKGRKEQEAESGRNAEERNRREAKRTEDRRKKDRRTERGQSSNPGGRTKKGDTSKPDRGAKRKERPEPDKKAGKGTTGKTDRVPESAGRDSSRKQTGRGR